MPEEFNNTSINTIKGVTTSSKFKSFVKDKMFAIVLSIGCFVFMFKDAIEWKVADENLGVLLTSMAITYFFTLYVILILGKMGIKSGKEKPIFIETMNYYSKAKTDIEPFRSYLKEYCILKTEEEKKLIQKEILDDENLEIEKLDLYKQEELTKQQWKAVQKARKLKVLRLQEKDLISERGKHFKSKYGTYLGKSEHDFMLSNNISNAFSKLIIPIVLTYLSIESIVLTDVLSGAIKVVVALFSGLFNFITNEDFVVNELRNRFINKADSLLEFKNLYEKGYFSKNEENK